MSTKNIISWDLGATKCAAALVVYNEQTKSLDCLSDTEIKINDCQSLSDLSDRLEHGLTIKMADADAICIGAAGQYNGQRLEHENGYPYPMEFASIVKHHQWPAMDVIHDYSPVICATFTSYMDDASKLKRLNDCPINPYGRRIVLGVGTGLGLKDGVLFKNGDFWLGTNEIGHIGIVHPPLAPSYYVNRHYEFIQFLRHEHLLAADEPLTFEKVLSGQGLVRLHAFYDRRAKHYNPEDVGAILHSEHGQETFALFAWYLGLFIGTVQLAFMPDGGIWITGGVIVKYPTVCDHPDFYQGIAHSPAYIKLREQFPLGVMLSSQHAFMGGAYYALKRLL
jgi:glucokinase